MKFVCPLIVVEDVHVSRQFYEKVLNQRVKFDFGENIVFEGGFSIQKKHHFARMININKDNIKQNSNNFELYFEEEDLDSFIEKSKGIEGIVYVHDLLEHSWGQRVVRFYDPDRNLIEVGESMGSVVKRFLSQGLSVEETAERTQHPVEFVQQFVSQETV